MWFCFVIGGGFLFFGGYALYESYLSGNMGENGERVCLGMGLLFILIGYVIRKNKKKREKLVSLIGAGAILEKAKIISINPHYSNDENHRKEIDGYSFQAESFSNQQVLQTGGKYQYYVSDFYPCKYFFKACTEEELVQKLVAFNIKESLNDKEKILHSLQEKIEQVVIERREQGLKGVFTKNPLSELQYLKIMVTYWPSNDFLLGQNRKFSVGDLVDIYIDPDDASNYLIK